MQVMGPVSGRLKRDVLVPVAQIWRESSTHYFGAHSVISPITSVPITDMYDITCTACR